MNTKPGDATSYFVLTTWCTAAKAWQDVPGRYESPDDARRMATERGIYRVAYMRDGRRLDMDPFAIIGDD